MEDGPLVTASETEYLRVGKIEKQLAEANFVIESIIADICDNARDNARHYRKRHNIK